MRVSFLSSRQVSSMCDTSMCFNRCPLLYTSIGFFGSGDHSSDDTSERSSGDTSGGWNGIAGGSSAKMAESTGCCSSSDDASQSSSSSTFGGGGPSGTRLWSKSLFCNTAMRLSDLGFLRAAVGDRSIAHVSNTAEHDHLNRND